MMDMLESLLLSNRVWDPSYLRDIFCHDFYEFQELWNCQISDTELVKEVQNVEKYQTIVEDIYLWMTIYYALLWRKIEEQ